MLSAERRRAVTLSVMSLCVSDCTVHTLEGLLAQPFEVVPLRRPYPAKNFHILMSEFEWSSFKSNIPGRVREHEAKIDVNEVAFTVDKNIPVVTVFDL